jgi:hypothetical protein
MLTAMLRPEGIKGKKSNETGHFSKTTIIGGARGTQAFARNAQGRCCVERWSPTVHVDALLTEVKGNVVIPMISGPS